MENNTNALGRKAWALSAIIFGWALCGYLAFRAAQLGGNNTTAFPDLCQAFFGNTCDKTLKSSVAVHLGFPLAGWGLAYFGLLGLLLSLRRPATDRLTVLLAAFGAGASGVLSVLILRANVSCPMCLGVHFMNLVTLVALFRSIRPHVPSTGQAAARGTFLRRVLPLLFVAALGAAAEYGVLRISFGKKPEINRDEIVKNFAGETVYNIPRDYSPRIGPSDAPVQIVVFSSFQCPGCKAFAPSLENIHRKFGDRVGITFKNFPLSTSCNPRISEDMQPRACDAAIAALAAQRQNLFWEYHDRVFQSDLEADENTLAAIAKNTGLDLAQWNADRQSEAVQYSLWEDVQLANELGINATPTVFINGRRVGSFEESVLSFLIKSELE